MLGTPAELAHKQGRVKIREFVQEIIDAIDATSALMAGKVKTKRADGWELSAKSVAGELTIIDPPYLLRPGQTARQAMVYFPGDLPEYSSQGAFTKVASLIAAWQNG